MKSTEKVSGRAFEIAPEKLTPYERNSRIHSPAQIEMIKASISEFGFIKPVICDEDKMLLAGHGAKIAAMELGLRKIPARMITGLTKSQKRAYVIADNRSSELSTWDWEMLTVELGELKSIDMDLTPLGFEDFGNERTHTRAGANVTLGEGRFLLQIEFQSEAELQKLFQELQERGLDLKVLE